MTEEAARTRSEARAVQPQRERGALDCRGALLSAAYFIVGFVLIVVVWEAGARLGLYPPYLLPAPSTIARRFVDTFGTMVPQMVVTAIEIAIGFVIALVGGVLMAGLTSFFKFVERALYPWLVITQVIPKIALGPLFIVWLGFGLLPKVLIAFLLAFFPIMIGTMIGLRSVERNSIFLLRTMGAGRMGIFWYVQLPNALPHLFGSLKVAITLAAVGAIVGEFIGANNGLGYVLVLSNGTLDTSLMFVSLVWISVLALAFYGVVVVAERLLLHWHVSQRGQFGGLNT
ncbi:MAG: ABC transporter permease [Xanthobacteraceae bacterium]